MAEGFTSYKIGNDEKFKAAIKRAAAATSDLTIPLVLIAKDFYKSEKAIFNLSGPGGYKDLALRTKERKVKKGVPIYPIFRGLPPSRGTLEASLTEPAAKGAVNQIINKRTLIIGSTIPYLVFHQSDRPRRKIPLRKLLFIGPESRFATSEQQGRVGRWLNILNDFVLKKLRAT